MGNATRSLRPAAVLGVARTVVLGAVFSAAAMAVPGALDQRTGASPQPAAAHGESLQVLSGSVYYHLNPNDAARIDAVQFTLSATGHGEVEISLEDPAQLWFPCRAHGAAGWYCETGGAQTATVARSTRLTVVTRP